MGKVTVFAEKQRNLTAVNLSPSHRWFWTCCTEGMERLLDERLEDGERVSFDLEASNFKRLERRIVGERSVREMVFNSNKTKIGVLAAWGIVLFALLARRVLGLGIEEVKIGVQAVTAIVCAHIIGYALTDALVHHGKGKSKE